MSKNLLKRSLFHKIFMEAPIPFVISSTEDGKYVDVNHAVLKYMGLPRKEVIGCSSIELGFATKEKRRLIIDEINKHGYAVNVPIIVCVKNQYILHMLFTVFQFKVREESFLFWLATDISNHYSQIKKFQNDLFIKIISQNHKSIAEKIKHYPLTHRQQEITLLALQGKSNKNIGENLHISEYTVKDHIKEIFRIIGIKKRSELIPKLLKLS